jgi:hypothetical protein
VCVAQRAKPDAVRGRDRGEMRLHGIELQLCARRVAVLEQALRQAHTGLGFADTTPCLTPMPYSASQVLGRKLGLAIVQRKRTLCAAMHRPECLGGQHLRVGRQHTKRSGAALRIPLVREELNLVYSSVTSSVGLPTVGMPTMATIHRTPGTRKESTRCIAGEEAG